MSGYETLSANSQNIKKFQLQQKARSLLVIAAIGIPVFLAMLAYLYYQDATKQNTSANLSQDSQAITLPEGTTSTITDPTQAVTDPNAIANSSTATGTSTAPNQSSAIQSPSNGVPAGVTTAMNSIEASGIKGNPYVASNLDTSGVPSGTSIVFNRGSWAQYSENAGTVKASVNVMGQNRAGSVTFSSADGTWKATGYTLD